MVDREYAFMVLCCVCLVIICIILCRECFICNEKSVPEAHAEFITENDVIASTIKIEIKNEILL